MLCVCCSIQRHQHDVGAAALPSHTAQGLQQLRYGQPAPSQHCLIEVIGAVCCCQNHDIGARLCQKAVPELHELCLHAGHRLVLMIPPPPQQRIDLVCNHAVKASRPDCWHGANFPRCCLQACFTTSVDPAQHSTHSSQFYTATQSCAVTSMLPQPKTGHPQRLPMKMMQGWILYASVNVACTSFCVSPNHLLCRVLARTLMKHAPDCRASACVPATCVNRVLHAAEPSGKAAASLH